MKPEIRSATDSDRAAIRTLLEGSGLPTEDLELAAPEFLVAVEDGTLIGAGALQRFGAIALLRSVVVIPEKRGEGCGQQIVVELERAAQKVGIRELVLLTLTAADFFGRLGYVRIERSGVAGPISDSAQFRSLCPASAVCMSKTLAVRSLRHA